MKPDVAVLIPAYNAKATLPRAVHSLLTQRLGDWIAVIASDDGTDYLAFLESRGLSDPRLLQVSTGRTGSNDFGARNAALAAAPPTPFLALLDADDAWAAAHLDSLLPLCAQRGIALLIGGAYNTGILATGAVEGAYFQYSPAPPEIMARVRRIEAVCGRHGVRLPTAALQFPLGHPAVASVVVGMRAPAEVATNVEVLAPDVPTDLWAELKAEGLLREDAPTP